MVKGVNNIWVIYLKKKQQHLFEVHKSTMRINEVDSTRHYHTFVQSTGLHDRY